MQENELRSSGSTPIFHIEVEKIKPNQFQPRREFNEEELKELASSIREFGILQPLVVSKIETETPYGTSVEYELIAGERRLRAAKLLGWERVPVIVRSVNQERERLELAMIENIQRSNLNPLETARAYAKLQEQFKLTQREVAARLGKSREAVANTLRLLDLPPFIQDALLQNKISESHARALLAVVDLHQQQALFEELVRSNLSVRELRDRIQQSTTVPTAQNEEKDEEFLSPEDRQIANQLEEILGTRVKVKKLGDKGKITINFYSQEELQNIIGKIISSGNSPLERPELF